MSAFDNAAFNTVHDFPGGAKALAEVLGVSAGVLRHRANPNDAANQFSVRDVIRIMLASQDFRMLHGMATDLGKACVLVDVPDLSASALAGAMNAAVQEFAQFLSVVTEATADNSVTPNELKRIDRELGELIQQANILRAVCAALGPGRKR